MIDDLDKAPDDFVAGNFVKLYGSIVTSSVWVEPDHVFRVWILFLALADAKGRVIGTVPGLASIARVSLEGFVEAIERFKAPDPFSRSKNDEGRRIVEIEGGWRIINHEKYRELRTEKQVKDAERQRRSRDRRDMSQESQPVATEAEAEADTDSSSSPEKPDVRLAQVLNTLGCDGSLSWSKLLSGMRQGLGAPGMQPLSWDVLLEAAQELRIEVDRTGGDITPARYKGFVGRVLNRKDREAEGGPHYSDRGLARKPKGYTLQAGEIRQRLLSARIRVQEGPRAGDYILPPKEWKQAFSESEVRAIEAIGAQRIMDADTKQQGIVLAQLARALEEAQT